MPTEQQIAAVVGMLAHAAREFGISDAFVVGGYPRNVAMGLPMSEVHDLDVASGTPEHAAQLAGFVAEEAAAEEPEIKHRTMTITLQLDGVEVDFQGPSAHSDVLPYLHMWGVDATPIALNVFDRDFTINSLAIPIGTEDILDLTGRGLEDIGARRIASITPASEVVPRNPLMITRAVKFSAKFGFDIDGELWEAMRDNVEALRAKISPERLAIEAEVLSKQDTAAMLKELGLSFLSSEEWIEAGERIEEEGG
jgi:tRNA nucleotidyltransferase/poly(A) polymerase